MYKPRKNIDLVVPFNNENQNLQTLIPKILKTIKSLSGKVSYWRGVFRRTRYRPKTIFQNHLPTPFTKYCTVSLSRMKMLLP